MDDNARDALVERVAEIMACADLWPTAWHGTHSLPPMPEPERNLWRERARAALSVIEPVIREATLVSLSGADLSAMQRDQKAWRAVDDAQDEYARQERYVAALSPQSKEDGA